MKNLFQTIAATINLRTVQLLAIAILILVISNTVTAQIINPNPNFSDNPDLVTNSTSTKCINVAVTMNRVSGNGNLRSFEGTASFNFNQERALLLKKISIKAANNSELNTRKIKLSSPHQISNVCTFNYPKENCDVEEMTVGETHCNGNDFRGFNVNNQGVQYTARNKNQVTCTKVRDLSDAGTNPNYHIASFRLADGVNENCPVKREKGEWNLSTKVRKQQGDFGFNSPSITETYKVCFDWK